jgi:hypothetical protein
MADVPVVKQVPISTVTGTTINIDFSSTLTLDHESEVPLMALLTRMASKKTLTHQFKFAVGRFAPRTGIVSGNVAATAVGVAATITVDHPEYFLPFDKIEVQANDGNDNATHTSHLLVTEVGASTITVKGYDPATYGVSAIADGAVLRVLYSTMKEGSSGRAARQTVPTVYEQYVQTFEDYFNVSNLQAENRQYIMPERVRLREEARKKHALDQEYAVWLGKKVKDVTSGGTGGGSTNNPIYEMDGVISQLKTNVLIYGASMTNDKLFDFMRDVHSPAYSGGMKRTVFASADLLSQVNKLPLTQVRITPRETTWGVNITEVAFMGKIWQWIEAPILSEVRSGWGVVTHPMYMQLRPFIPTQYRMNVQNNKDNYFEDGFITSTSVAVYLEEVFGLIKP